METTSRIEPEAASDVPEDAGAARAPRRFHGLDALRGLAVAGMIAVNAPAGAGGEKPSALQHAEWHGLAPADVVFPAFLVAVGVALGLGPEARRGGASWWRLARRVLVLVLLGIAVNALREPSLAEVRLPGVLQRIGLAGGLAGAVLLLVPHRWSRGTASVVAPVVAAAALLGATAWLLAGDDLTREGSVVGAVDRAVFTTRHLYNDGGFDPEGLVGVLPSAATVLLGAGAGRWLAARGEGLAGALGPAVLGAACLGLGLAWSAALPLNKQLWTPSYALATSGWSLLALAVLAAVAAAARGRGRHLLAPASLLGANALVAYVGSTVTIHLLVQTPPDGPSPVDRIVAGLLAAGDDPVRASLVVAAWVLAAWWVVVAGLAAAGVRVRA